MISLLQELTIKLVFWCQKIPKCSQGAMVVLCVLDCHLISLAVTGSLYIIINLDWTPILA